MYREEVDDVEEEGEEGDLKGEARGRSFGLK